MLEESRVVTLPETLVNADTVMTPADTATPTDTPAVVSDSMAAVVLDYCVAVRGILNEDQGGLLSPPGLRMAAALTEVRASLHRNLDAKKGGAASVT